MQIADGIPHPSCRFVIGILRMQERDIVRKEQAGMPEFGEISTRLLKKQASRGLKSLLIRESILEIALCSYPVIRQHGKKALRVTFRGGFNTKSHSSHNSDAVAFSYRRVTR